MKGVIATLLFSLSASALTTQDLTTQTPQQLAQTFLGSGVTISNVQFTGAPVAAGTFSGGAAEGLGINSGVILSTGNIASASGPNTDDGITTANAQPGDASLQALLPEGQTSEDATVLEFDFVPSSNRISFRYVFASEEYNEYVAQDYNDIFAFFLNGQNIALIPGTVQAVAIDNVNAGTNASLYRNNDPSDFDPTPYGTQFDGFTVVLTAEAAVTPGVSHHIKLAITDVNDELLDSAVFFEAASLVSGCQLTVTATDAVASEAGPDAGTFTITRAGDTSAEVTVSYTLSGTAANGDYAPLTGTATIPAGQTSTTVTITPVDDVLSEGNETVILTLTSGACTTSEPSSATITIADNDAVAACVVSIATTNNGAEGGAAAQFTVTRTGSTADPVTIGYTVSGTATSGSDFTPQSGSVTIPAGQSSATITIPIADDAAVEGAETIVVTLTGGGGCAPGAQSAATATVADNDAPSTVENVPTLGEWALLALAAMLGGLGLFSIRT